MLRSQVVVWCVCFGLPFCEALQWMVLGKKPLFSLVLTWLRFFLPRRGPLWKAKSWQYTGEKKLGRPPGRLGLRHKDPSSQAGLPSNGNNKVLLYCSLTMCRADGQLIGNWVWPSLSLSSLVHINFQTSFRGWCLICVFLWALCRLSSHYPSLKAAITFYSYFFPSRLRVSKEHHSE